MAFSAGIKAKGEVSVNQQLYTNQIAPTIMHILSMDFEKDMPGKPIEID
jgi:bisphosphoglycerate-independent phosphoglycerate mutase (AlkP superfamily)